MDLPPILYLEALLLPEDTAQLLEVAGDEVVGTDGSVDVFAECSLLHLLGDLHGGEGAVETLLFHGHALASLVAHFVYVVSGYDCLAGLLVVLFLLVLFEQEGVPGVSLDGLDGFVLFVGVLSF